MTEMAPYNAAELHNAAELSGFMRPASVVMELSRLGTFYPYPLSFMRCLVRRIERESWDIKRAQVNLCAEGYGDVIYEIKTPHAVFSYVIFAKYLAPAGRSDRVIAEDWDMTVTLCEGRVDAARLDFLRRNVPLQENGRVDTRCLVLSRANKSVRNFDYVVERLTAGKQPDLDVMAKVGYLYRTTAVYGSGKFGMADWDKLCRQYPDFARPFAAEMFSCYLIRDFSLFQAEHVAQCRAPDTAAVMDVDIKRYVGIGNATGLGMAPYLINHPLLINNWIELRETALARIKKEERITQAARSKFQYIGQKAIQHLGEIMTDNAEQNVINAAASADMIACLAWVKVQGDLQNWTQITDYAQTAFGSETQELIHAVLLELYPNKVVDLEERLAVIDRYDLVPDMAVPELISLIENRYDWALAVDFNDDACRSTFWYSSEEKKEPRLGKRFEEPGAEKEMFLGIACAVRSAYDQLVSFAKDNSHKSTAQFVTTFPEHRYIIRRIQTMGQTRYGEIRANVLDADVLPIHLLRCKLSFFGVGKFDPRSRLWVRNTMFQGAPLVCEVREGSGDQWYFPIKPNLDAQAA